MKFGQSLAVSLAALLCTTSLALAQAPDKGAGGMPGGASQAPAEKMEKGHPGGAAAGRGQESRQPSRDQSQSGERRGAERAPDKGKSERAQGGERSSDRAQRPQRGKDENKAAQGGREQDQQKSQRTDGDRGQGKAARTGRDREQERAAQEKAAQEKPARSAHDRDQEKSQRTQRGRQEGKAADGRTPDKTGQMQPASRVQASEKQHADVRQHVLRDRKVERTRINVSDNIGSAVPRSVRLRPLSAAVVSFAPVYRGYSYIVLEDETICIVDPRSYVIVDVIAASTQRAEGPGAGGHLSLSADERRFILTSIDRQHSADINVRLALGAEVPRAVEVLAFPERVIERIPQLHSYRYVVAQDQVVVVDASDHQVALLISD